MGPRSSSPNQYYLVAVSLVELPGFGQRIVVAAELFGLAVDRFGRHLWAAVVVVTYVAHEMRLGW